MTPGGDFSWLKLNVPTTTESGTGVNKGERHGHNVIAPERGYLQDSRLSVAPGGVYLSENLACNSCHDPHGLYRRFADNTFHLSGLPISSDGSYDTSPDPVSGVTAVTSYRMLAGIGYLAGLESGSPFSFKYDPPHAVAPSEFNRLETTSQTRVAYGAGMSEWCANCHPGMLENAAGPDRKMHPAGKTALLGTYADTYNAYISSGNLTGNYDRSYNSLVPFEEGAVDYPALKSHAKIDDSYLQGPDRNGTVMCLTCHRAHASGFESLLRFPATSTFITIADANGAAYDTRSTDNTNNNGLNEAAQISAFYGRKASSFGPYARTLCNKCHAKD